METARDFGSALEACDFCRAENLREVDLIIRRPNQPPLLVPINKSSGLLET